MQVLVDTGNICHKARISNQSLCEFEIFISRHLGTIDELKIQQIERLLEPLLQKLSGNSSCTEVALTKMNILNKYH